SPVPAANGRTCWFGSPEAAGPPAARCILCADPNWTGTAMQTLAIIGAGPIGRAVALACGDGRAPCRVTAVCDLNPAAAEPLRAEFAPDAQILPVEEACAAAGIVLESASPAAVPLVLNAARSAYGVRKNGKNWRPQHVIVMTIGGLLNCDPFAQGPV